ncbi:MAG: hypothetical protein IJZ98_02175 [Bacteroidales bacterium]|nr:hypothetical protein [Bacteroidales bacterium]
MKRQFMKSLGAFCVGVMTLFAASSCYDDLELRNEISDLNQGLEDLKARVEALETKLNSELGKIQRLFQEADAAIEAKIQVASVETNADGKIVITLTDGDTFEVEPADRNTNPILTIVEDGGVQYWATVDAAGKATSIGIPVTHTDIEFKFEENVIYYTLDGGKNWVKVATIPEDAAAPIITNVTYTDKTATFYLGDYSFTVDIAEPLSFEIRSGKVYFQSEGTQKVAVKTSGVTDVTVMAAPKGWWAEVNSDGQIEITAPSYEDTEPAGYDDNWNPIPGPASASGFVKVHACGTDGKCMVGKIAVEVSQYPLVVNAYGGNAYFEIVGETSWYSTFFYGISTKETLEADLEPIIKGLNSGDWSIYDNYLNNNREPSVTASIAELLGSEPVLGTEYVVWALMENNNVLSYSIEDVMLKYYALTDVKITENEAERTAYNIEINVEVSGADSYVAVAMPQNYCDDVYFLREQMAMAMASGSYYGKLYTENYTGSALEIAAGTNFSMTGLYSPNSSVYVFVLPVDGRPADMYTVEDVIVAEFKTANLLPGGVIDATAEQVKEYMGMVFSYDDWQYHEQLIVLDKYTELGVALTPSFTEGWTSFYYTFMSDDEWAVYGSDDALIVTKLLEEYGMTPDDYKDGFPAYLVEKVNPGEGAHFVAFFVDEDGKYGNLAKVDLKAETLEYSAMTLEVTSNLQNGVLANTNTLELTLTPSEEVSKYLYRTAVTNYWDPFDGMDAAAIADNLFLGDESEEFTPADLTDGKYLLADHKYGNSYVLAIIACDANGAPMTEAVVLKYDNMFSIENVISDPSAFVGEPVVEVHMPTTIGEADGICYYWEDQTAWDMGYRYHYNLNYTVTPAEGTQVKTLFVDLQAYGNVPADAAGRASGLWQDSWEGAYYSQLDTEPVATTSSVRFFSHSNSDPIPEVILMVSWTDADGNYYYKEVDLSEDLAALKANLDADLGLGEEETATPDGKIWVFDWEGFGVPAVWDFGTTEEGVLHIAYDLATAYDDETLAGQYMSYNNFQYTVTPTDATSGTVDVIAVDPFTGIEQATSFTYTDLTETSCTFLTSGLIGEDTYCTLVTETITIVPNEYGIGM